MKQLIIIIVDANSWMNCPEQERKSVYTTIEEGIDQQRSVHPALQSITVVATAELNLLEGIIELEFIAVLPKPAQESMLNPYKENEQHAKSTFMIVPTIPDAPQTEDEHSQQTELFRDIFKHQVCDWLLQQH